MMEDECKSFNHLSTSDETIKKLATANKLIEQLKCKLSKQIAYCEVLRQENELLNQQLFVNKETVACQTDTSSFEINAFDSNTSIADCLRETAEECLQKTGYVFDERTGLYYDYNSGYYYDPENQLFYEPRQGIYYSYNSETKEYAYHSRVDPEKLKKQYEDMIIQSGIQHLPPSQVYPNNKVSTNVQSSEEPKPKKLTKKEKRELRRQAEENSKQIVGSKLLEEKSIKYKRKEIDEMEDGEIEDSDNDAASETSPRESMLADQCEDNDSYGKGHAMDKTDLYPPCIRLIVRSSSILDPGSLSIITCEGGSIGRDTRFNHTIIMEDARVNQNHCEFVYDYEEKAFFVLDKGSQYGTFINKKRLSKPRKCSSAIRVKHEDLLHISDSSFILHIHAGRETCSGCEPGQVQAFLQNMLTEERLLNREIELMNPSVGNAIDGRKHKLNQIKKKYGLKNPNPGLRPASKSVYIDRAAIRRTTVGSDNGFQIPNHEPASVHSAISSDNKGAKLLSKMGWKAGESLGKSQDGIKEPINVHYRINPKAGLGSETSINTDLDSVNAAENKLRWIQMTERYRKLETHPQNVDNSFDY